MDLASLPPPAGRIFTALHLSHCEKFTFRDGWDLAGLFRPFSERCVRQRVLHARSRMCNTLGLRWII